ncbi:MAG TPA: hypothetical protein VGP24_07540 [Glaciihabitans sp.]|nr:hypothetical protein [Glaciihabitans sp.]
MIVNGILLCKHHHLLLHNEHWTITATPDGFLLTAPVNLDPSQTPRPMPHKSPALAAHLAAQRVSTDP